VSNIRLDNLNEGKKYKLSSDAVNVTLRGDIGEYFSYFDESDITVVLDMKNYNDLKGNVKVPAEILINNESSSTMIYAVGSYSVSLTLE
jgi:YbbR domain-containing protein